MTVRIHVGDVREQLRAMPDAFFDCVVTSPPYWGLRDYGVDGQIGLERTLGEHIAVMVEVFREVRRVLKPRGTFWLNYGDCYAAAPNGKSAADYKADGSDDRTFRDKPFSTVGPINPGRTYYGAERGSRGVDRDFHDHMRPKAGPVYSPGHHGDRGERGNIHRRSAGVTAPGAIVAGGFLKPKDLCMIPNRLAIALQDDGWWVRSEIIWHKPNPMPESVYDRPTTAHEKVWLLTKSEDYFYNHEAIREPVTGGAHVRAAARATDTGVGWGRLDRLDPDQQDRGRDRVKRPGPNSRQNVDRTPRSRKGPKDLTRDEAGLKTSDRFGRGAGWRDQPGVTPKHAGEDTNVKAKGSFLASVTQLVETRNARNVWTIAPKAYREAHFATFPPALAERCIKAGVPAQACGLCGAALPHPRCEGLCRFAEPVAGRVLDPFGGAGTVGLVATNLGLDATLIELNPEYAAMSARRIGAAAEIVGAPAPVPMAAE